MIGFDKPVCPEWIHAVGLAWRPHQPVSELITVVDQVAATEFRGSETRRKVATIILRCFVETEGGGPDRKTRDRDLFATAAGKLSAEELRSVYLAHLINTTPILQMITGQMAKRYGLGDEIQSTDFLHRIYEQYGQRGVVTNCVRHFLRTLSWFGCLRRLAPNHYRFHTRLPITEQTFPLLVYSWLQSGLGSSQITPFEFGEQSAFYFLDATGLPGYFLRFNTVFWAVEKRMAVDRVTLKYARIESFEEALLSYLESTLEPHSSETTIAHEGNMT
ncbi:MAG: hypothetical protein WBW48_15455 [Anaerolineae bacterium]